jgi:hypothetical protein
MNATPNNTLPTVESKRPLQTCGGMLHYQWDDQVPITQHGYMPFFAEYLKAGGLFERFVANSPLSYKSNNAPEVGDVLVTMLMSVLSGHTRYRHAQSLYGDSVIPGLLGAKNFVSYDSLRKAFLPVSAEAAEQWLQEELYHCYEPLLTTGYVLDIDPTVKPLYGKQEGAEIGYNPKKPGRPAHCYHSYFIGTLRLVMEVEVHPGNQTAGVYSHPGLWRLFDERIPRHLWPKLIRGDIGFGNEATIFGCQSRGLKYLFKLRQSAKVKKLIEQLNKKGGEWQDAGGGWQGCESLLQLQGWTASRRVIVLRRQVKKDQSQRGLRPLPVPDGKPFQQGEFIFPEIVDAQETPDYEWAVLVTNLDYPLEALAQLYRDRGDCENIFDELKNQWGWGGFTTRDIKRSAIMARITALFYNWWNIFCRLAEPEKHLEAQTSRPLLQNVIGRMSASGGKRLIHLTAVGAQATKTMAIFEVISQFLRTIFSTAAQLDVATRWATILAHAFKKFYRRMRPPQAASAERQLLLLLT